ncbi:hypothetical protein [Streptomyces sp. NPDC014685]|uniref:hypothetical protein n=1 Tax=Streptomyces sp. NPDC014685 TaxID=3364881 RepID=UPI0036FB9735
MRQDDPVKRAVMHLGRAMRGQPDRLCSAVRTIQQLLEAEKVPDNVARLRLALGRGQTQLEERARQRQTVLAVTGSDDALHLHRDLLHRLQRPAPADDTDLPAQITAECVQLRRQW